MKIWKEKVKIPKFGVCEVRELSDKEADFKGKPPISHGFVNLYKNGKHVGWCGRFYAEKHLITGAKKGFSTNENRFK
jgi:hypothetical protein